MSKSNTHQINDEAIALVVKELESRGCQCEVKSIRGAKHIIAFSKDGACKLHIRVKSKLSGKDWQGSTDDGEEWGNKPEPQITNNYWIFVDLMKKEFRVVPEWWIKNDIFTHHAKYLVDHNGDRPKSPGSTHHRIEAERLEKWHNCWEILGL